MAKSNHRITFLPSGKSVTAQTGENLLRIISAAGIPIDGSCNGKGTCGSCKVKLLRGKAAPADPRELATLTPQEAAEGYRLSCLVHIEDDLQVYIPQLEQTDHRKARLSYMPPHFDPAQMEKKPGLGLAFDVGTTTVVAILWDMSKTEIVDIVALTNPQSAFGADVISRIDFTLEAPENLALLQEKIIDCCNQMVGILQRKHGFEAADIVEAVMVGNTTMSHLFLGKSVKGLAKLPFAPAFEGLVETTAQELGMKILPAAPVHVLPNIASHVGSDITAGLIAGDMWNRPGRHIFLDIGTNGEIALFSDGAVFACSTAAGPAFEGASIYHGMRAAAGAIEGVRITDGQVELDIIDGGEPLGICGSGLIDAIAAMLDAGLISKSGLLLNAEAAAEKNVDKKLLPRLRKREGITEFVLYQGAGRGDIVITQKDVREVQLGKGAIASGMDILLENAKIDASAIDSLVLAGAFGNYIKKESALRIGLLPPLAPEKIISIGNAPGIGASMTLLSPALRQETHKLISDVIHVELADWPSFQNDFVRAMSFPASS